MFPPFCTNFRQHWGLPFSGFVRMRIPEHSAVRIKPCTKNKPAQSWPVCSPSGDIRHNGILNREALSRPITRRQTRRRRTCSTEVTGECRNLPLHRSFARKKGIVRPHALRQHTKNCASCQDSFLFFSQNFSIIFREKCRYTVSCVFRSFAARFQIRISDETLS